MAETDSVTDGSLAGQPVTIDQQAFRFFDNREKYLMFVTTTSEKWAVAQRIGQELRFLKPRPPALRLFDAGMGDGTVLTHVLRDLHRHFPTVPFSVVGKEISLEDVRLSLEKLPDRLFEHPQSVFTITNLFYSEAPWLRPNKPEAQARLKRWDIALEGNTAQEFQEQIRDLLPILAEGWQATSSPKTGNPIYVTPSILVIHRKDQMFALHDIIPRSDSPPDGYDLVLASQPFRARLAAELKVRNVLAPLARSLAPGGRLIVIQSTGRDPGLEIIRGIWPDEQPFITPRHALVEAAKAALSESNPDLNYEPLADDEALFRYELQAMPSELGDNIGTSTMLAAWNAAIYVAQIEDERLVDALAGDKYLHVTQETLRKHDGLWFEDESFIITRPRR